MFDFLLEKRDWKRREQGRVMGDGDRHSKSKIVGTEIEDTQRMRNRDRERENEGSLYLLLVKEEKN